ncbi:hypothetical protein F5B22DRAFT_661292 [Xylaria bambusicola]|uniref:uncharacterized protein n=1 Tax=Xylaria bambusicola TaxID=326684 RepID=UPI002008A81D|nr:uncharacterized protein F5B22DRAFT_661292 [Xylaria bambusicola]KAI0521921.1 hypothetical protein F5B22DRAFT_661292 [Xylaria bambusicola]
MGPLGLRRDFLLALGADLKKGSQKAKDGKIYAVTELPIDLTFVRPTTKRMTKAEQVARLKARVEEQNQQSLESSSAPPTPYLSNRFGKTLFCRICRSNRHITEDFMTIFLDPEIPERQQGFKRWCPKHNSTSHTLDQCKAKWEWLRNKELAIYTFIYRCASGPAWATDLIDWRVVMEADKFQSVPWTPEFSIQKKLENPDFQESRLRPIDPETCTVYSASRLPYQTLSGEEPKFHTLEDLCQHAEEQYQKERTEQKRRGLVENAQQETEQVLVDIQALSQHRNRVMLNRISR